MNPSTAAATAIVDALVEAGVREVVLCPGSRSAPIAYAVRAAERAGRLRLHVRVDERSAGFLALGLGKRRGGPAVVVTTSGTAVANLHPAVLEAHHARVPLVVLSADRPEELRGTGANQTTTQPGIFAGAVRAEADLAPLESFGGQNAAGLRSAVVEIVASAQGAGAVGFPGSGAGPVHLNVQLREPLVPDLDGEPRGTPGPRPSVPTDVPQRRTGVSRRLRYSDGDEPSPRVGAARPPPPQWSADQQRTLVVLGDLPRAGQAEVALAWANERGLPVVAEPFGPHPRDGVVAHGVLVLADAGFVDAHPPHRVVVIGRPTLSRPVSALVRRPGVGLLVVESGPQWSVPARDLTRVPWAWLESGPGPGSPASDSDWTDAWFERGAEIEASLVNAPPHWPSGAAVARTLGASLPADALLFVGSSNAPRDLDAALGARAQRLDIVASRGLAGIDGCVSTAVGLALAEPERPAYALMGDLTFLHDANGLLIGPAEPRPDLTIVVVNDDGGGIFHVLEPGEPERAEDFERLFGTSTGTDLAALCRAHGIRYLLATTWADLAAAVAARPMGLAIVEVPADRRVRRADAAGLRAR